jgi:hypothetical protein
MGTSTYKGFTIQPDFVYTDGKFDGIYYFGDVERAWGIYRQTLDQVKDAIDEKLFMEQTYAVGNERFDFISQAIEHTRQFGGIVEPKFQFDSI